MRNKYHTEMRAAALEYLKEQPDMTVTAKDVLEHLTGRGINANITSVYRYLDALVLEGAVKKYVNHKGQESAFQYIGEGGGCDRHLHLQCSHCGQIVHLDCEFMDRIADHIWATNGFSLDCKTSILYGKCFECSKRTK